MKPVWHMSLGAFLISFSSLFVAIAGVSAESSAFYRMFFGSLILVAWLILRKSPWRVSGYSFFMLALASAFFALDLSLWHQSILYVGPGLATLLANLQVFVMPVIGMMLFAETLRAQYFIGAALAIVGLWFQIGYQWSQFSETYQLGILLGVLTALAYTGFMLTLKRVQLRAPNESAMTHLAWISLFTSLFLALSLQTQGQSWTLPNIQALLVLLAYGGLCQVLGWWMITRSMPYLATTSIALMLLLQPTFSYVWDILFLQRPITLIEILGVLLTLTGIYLGMTGKQTATKADSE